MPSSMRGPLAKRRAKIALALTCLAAALACATGQTNSGTGVDLEEAVRITLRDVVGSDTLDRTLLALPQPLEAGDTVAPDMGESSSGYMVDQRSWLLFVDDQSSYRWAHACRYVLVDTETGQPRVIRESWWPRRRDSMDTIRVWR